MQSNFWKITSCVLFVLLIISIVYYFYTKPEYVELERPQAEQQEINIAEQIAHAKDSLSNLYNDSLTESRNNIKVITKTVYKEQEQIIKEPVTNERISKTLNYFADYYDKKVHEIGVDPSPEIKIPEINMTTKQFKGAELVRIELDYKTQVNTELNKQIGYFQKQIVFKDGVIRQKDKIIDLKERQLVKLENTKVPVVSSRKFTTDIATHGGAILIGFVLGIVYQNNK